MATDHAPALIADPGTFIANASIALSEIAVKLGVGGIPALDNLRCTLTLSQSTWLFGAVFAPASMPMLRMLPGLFAPGLTSINAYYCRAGAGVGGWGVDALPYVDIPIAPIGTPRFLFTTGMNGCALIVASAVPGTAPAPLPPLHYRVLHDPRHYTLAHWAAAGYTVRFATYAGAAEAGPIPPAFAAAINSTNYNPNNYPWHYMDAMVAVPRVVTNFLHYDGAAWNYHSCHFHDHGGVPRNVDAPPGTVPAVSSTQSMLM